MDHPLMWTIDKDKLFSLISSGMSDRKAAALLGFDDLKYSLLLANQSDVAEVVADAIKARADYWVDRVMETATYEYTKEEVPSAKLQFEKLKYLASIDNPDKYSEKNSKQDVNVNVFDIKTITDAKALKAIKDDPFAVEAEYSVKPDEIVEEDLL